MSRKAYIKENEIKKHFGEPAYINSLYLRYFNEMLLNKNDI